MLEEGIAFARKNELLSWEELLLLAKTFVALGVRKIRITGGEPFLRKGLMPFLETLSKVPGLESISLTTNATRISGYINALKKCNIRDINISLDSLDKTRFYHITRRDCFDTVMGNVHRLISEGFKVKINCVVMGDENIEDIIPLIHFAHQYRVTVRFLEEMPFNGQAVQKKVLLWDYIKILEHIKIHFPDLRKLPVPKNSTAMLYKAEGMKGIFGVIPSFSRTFCGTCNRIRVSAKGEMQTCLYATETIDLKVLMNSYGILDDLKFGISHALQSRYRNGFEAEKHSENKKSMALIGG